MVQELKSHDLSENRIQRRSSFLVEWKREEQPKALLGYGLWASVIIGAYFFKDDEDKTFLDVC